MFGKPHLVVSRCLLGEPVRYDGGRAHDEFCARLLQFVEPRGVCPELEAGLGVPRPAMALFREQGKIRLRVKESGEDRTRQLEKFSEQFFQGLLPPDGFLLKARSPSCGVGDARLYEPGRGAAVAKSNGLFAARAAEAFPHVPLEDEKRLLDYWLRRHFLTRIFALADLRRSVGGAEKIRDILDFHERNKYLLMLYSQSRLRQMGRLLADWKSQGLDNTRGLYLQLFREALARKPSLRRHLNVLQHIYGYFSGGMNAAERRHFQSLLARLDAEPRFLDTIIEYLRGLVFRFENYYLSRQTCLYPFPGQLEKLAS